MGSFKKLFTINYNSKKFLILVDERHRFTFLEIAANGKYIYPQFEDYKALSEIYNNFDRTVVPSVLKMTYEEKVRLKSFLLSVITAVSLGIGKGNITGESISLNRDENDKPIVTVTGDVSSIQSIYDRETVDSYFNNEIVTRDDVINAINNNTNLTDSFKKAAIELMDINLRLDPNANLRIYYENMKELQIVLLSKDEMTQNGTLTQNGYVEPNRKRIYLIEEDYKDGVPDNYSRMTCLHELNHFFHLLWIGEKGVYFDELSVLHEAMTSKTIGQWSSYMFEQCVLDFLMENTDSFDYHTYNSHGICALIDELESKYPNVDIDYIISYMQANFYSSYYNIPRENEPFEDIDFCDELFGITLANINEDEAYKSFALFSKMLGMDEENKNASYNIVSSSKEIYDRYFDLYNENLVDKGIITRDMLDVIKNVNYIIIINGKLYLTDELDYGDTSARSRYTSLGSVDNMIPMNKDIMLNYFNDEGNKEQITIKDDVFQTIWLDNVSKGKIIQCALDCDYKGNITSQEFLQKLNADYNLYNDTTYMKYSNGELAIPEITDDMYVEIGYNNNGEVGLILYDNDRLIYGTCDSLASPTAKISYKKYIHMIGASYSQDKFTCLDDIISVEALDSIPGYLLVYFMPNMHIDYEPYTTTNSDGSLSYNYNHIYSFKEPFRTFVDGEELSLGGMWLCEEFSENIDEGLCLFLHISDDRSILIGSIEENDYWFTREYVDDVYVQNMDEILDYLGIEPVNGVYNFTTDSLLNIIDEYIKSEPKNEQIENGFSK